MDQKRRFQETRPRRRAVAPPVRQFEYQSSLQVDPKPVGGLLDLFGGLIKAVSNIADYERAQADPCNYHQHRIPFIRLRRINEFRANNCHVSSRYAGSPLGSLPSSPLQKMLSAISDTV
jgi:hypothetical protein